MSQQEANDPGRNDPGQGSVEQDSSEPPVQLPTDAPGVKLGKIGMILAMIPFTAFVGVCCSVLAMVLSRQVGATNKRAVIGIVVGVAWLIVGVVLNSLFFMQN